jgi:hypothetical protein
MKTRIKISLGVAIVLAAGFIQIQEKEQNDISLLNVEALAASEWGSEIICIHIGSVDCPISSVKVYKVLK